MRKLILTIDEGTTGVSVFLFDPILMSFIGHESKDFTQHYPETSWVEHDANEIWDAIIRCTQELITKLSINSNEIAGIGITNQRETLCAFDKKGNPLTRAIVWQDKRTQNFCEEHKEKSPWVKAKTGLPLDPYFSATKMQWLLTHNQAVKDAKAQNNLCFGTIDCFLLFKLTSGRSFATDATNASRTLLMNLETQTWDDELLNFFQIPQSSLPEIKPTLSHFGETLGCGFLPDGIPILCLIGDQQSALLGQGALESGQMKCTYGTGAFLLMNTGENRVDSPSGLLTTVALKTSSRTTFALEGSSYIAGALVQWLRDEMKFFTHSGDIEKLASTSSEESHLHLMNDLFFFPFLSGLGSPDWKAQAKGIIAGLTRGTSQSQLAFAALEGVAMAVGRMVKTFEQETKTHLSSLSVDGGMCANDLFLQIQSNVLDKKVLRPFNLETTGLGASLGASVSLGVLREETLKNSIKIEKNFNPSPQNETRKYFQKKDKNWNEQLTRFYL